MPDINQRPLTYRDAGVDREVGARAKHRIAELVESTRNAQVVSRAGGFGGLFRVPDEYRSPVMVASADGVGTKLKLAFLADRHDTVGVDLVNHCVNDILVEGARPLFFLDYIGMGALDPRITEAVVTGLAGACRQNGCVLLGGETAQMPDFYAPGEYDLAGFIVGMLDESQRLGAHLVRDGDILIGLAASGFHTNGYSLLRRVFFDRLGLGIHDRYPGLDRSLVDVLLTPHRTYAPVLRPLIDAGRVHALAHITGGGVQENLARVLPRTLDAEIERGSWTVPPEYDALREYGGIMEDELFHTFNMGVGMIVVSAPEHADAVQQQVQAVNVDATVIGRVRPGAGEVRFT